MSELLEKIDPIDLNAITPPGQVCTELLDSAILLIASYQMTKHLLAYSSLNGRTTLYG